MTPGSILWDDTTDSAQLARELYTAAKEKGVSFIDAPVSGGQSGAEKGVLTVMCGGDEGAFEAGKAAAAAFSCAVTRIGEAGAGQLAKMVNQICIAGIVQGLSEAAAFGMNAGLDMDKVFSVLEKAPRVPGRWRTAERRWSAISLISGLLSTG